MNEMERNGEMQQKQDELSARASEMQEKVTQSINTAMKTAADSLDETANRMHQASQFFRGKNVDNLKQDFSTLIKKYPTQSIAGAIIFGFLFGRVLSR